MNFPMIHPPRPAVTALRMTGIGNGDMEAKPDKPT